MWRLEVHDWAGLGYWNWRLFDNTGNAVVEQTVAPDTDAWQFEAFINLYQFLRFNAAPERRLEHEAELIGKIGEWAGLQLLGAVGPQLAAVHGPVLVEVPAEAAVLGYLPWELAQVGGRFLIAHRTNLVVVPQPRQVVVKRDVGQRLRMLAVFSLPDGTGVLNLRKERYGLSKIVNRISTVSNRSIELRVLQYGVTRDSLKQILLEAAGWDVVHMSGHGLQDGLVLEDPEGHPDLISGRELVELLDLCRDQIKLVVLSACDSSAVTPAEYLRYLNSPREGHRAKSHADGGEVGLGPGTSFTRPEAPAVSVALVEELDCAVIAMRYPVIDDFSIALSASFYDLLLAKGQSVSRALALALNQDDVMPRSPSARAPALSLGTPTLIGFRAADLTLAPPPGQAAKVDTDVRKLAGFPEQPSQFVGRVGVLRRSSTVLAPESGSPGIMLYGMPGVGKTACAIELAYAHEESFPLMAWFAMPASVPVSSKIEHILTDFARALEQQLPGLKWAHLIPQLDQLYDFLPQLTQIMRRNRILLVIDNLQSMLSESGEWQDQRWAAIIDALTRHAGLSRLVLTSRWLPGGLATNLKIEQMHPLSLRESVLLARSP